MTQKSLIWTFTTKIIISSFFTKLAIGQKILKLQNETFWSDFQTLCSVLEVRKAWLSNMFWSVTTYELIVSIGAPNPVNLTTWVLANWHSVTALWNSLRTWERSGPGFPNIIITIAAFFSHWIGVFYYTPRSNNLACQNLMDLGALLKYHE